ncbi:hypothetical protein LTR37_017085 [Vermiconidia calcicola]|uniref:Uncharacterized protein n=1 Tax=Vermiconidia calcicola TaxID=1690605 RepID=A0ACC3MKY6_9PEZI|nr:hypothetical protein LTR37_017085 [Vermiconidia calcicola]
MLADDEEHLIAQAFTDAGATHGDAEQQGEDDEDEEFEEEVGEYDDDEDEGASLRVVVEDGAETEGEGGGK